MKLLISVALTAFLAACSSGSGEGSTGTGGAAGAGTGGSGGSSTGGSGGSGGSCPGQVPDAGSIVCGSNTCTADQICVFHCCGGAPTDGGTACKPAPPSCVDASAITCTPCDQGTNCSAAAEGCSGTLVGQTLNCLCG